MLRNVAREDLARMNHSKDPSNYLRPAQCAVLFILATSLWSRSSKQPEALTIFGNSSCHVPGIIACSW
jgi:hypothetical protein